MSEPGLMSDRTLILASASAARARLLNNAGLEFEILCPHIDERKIQKAGLLDKIPVEQTAQRIALEKAKDVWTRLGDREVLVLGVDQILVHREEILTKASNLQDLREKLKRLRGQRHRLITAAIILGADREPLSIVDTASLTMRNFSDRFLNNYVQRCGDKLLSSVGGYQLENEGIQLFETIEGDYFTILGLPLLPLLKVLRGLS